MELEVTEKALKKKTQPVTAHRRKKRERERNRGPVEACSSKLRDKAVKLHRREWEQTTFKAHLIQLLQGEHWHTL